MGDITASSSSSDNEFKYDTKEHVNTFVTYKTSTTRKIEYTNCVFDRNVAITNTENKEYRCCACLLSCKHFELGSSEFQRLKVCEVKNCYEPCFNQLSISTSLADLDNTTQLLDNNKTIMIYMTLCKEHYTNRDQHVYERKQKFKMRLFNSREKIESIKLKLSEFMPLDIVSIIYGPFGYIRYTKCDKCECTCIKFKKGDIIPKIIEYITVTKKSHSKYYFIPSIDVCGRYIVSCNS